MKRAYGRWHSSLVRLKKQWSGCSRVREKASDGGGTMARSDFDEFRALLSKPEEGGERAPSSLKARLYSAVVRKQQESGPLASLDETVAAGHELCVFERLVQVSPVDEQA